MSHILHICEGHAWVAAEGVGEYRAPSLTSEGFIHCSTIDQVLIPANAMFAGQTGLVLLFIDEDAVDADVIYEDCYDSGIEFPHVYGPIPSAAVVDVIDFPPQEDGTFRLPPQLE